MLVLLTREVLCSFSAVGSADPSLGMEYYDIIETNRKTGEERVVGSRSSNLYSNALWESARKEYAKAVKKHFGADVKLK